MDMAQGLGGENKGAMIKVYKMCKVGRWFQNDLTTQYKEDGLIVPRQPKLDTPGALHHVMGLCIDETKILTTERIGKIFLNVWPALNQHFCC